MRTTPGRADKPMNKTALTDRADTLITGNSEMAHRIRAFDWSKTPLGRIDEWSETLLATANLIARHDRVHIVIEIAVAVARPQLPGTPCSGRGIKIGGRREFSCSVDVSRIIDAE